MSLLRKRGKVQGSCLCGAVHFEATLPSRFCAHCHCSNCRRAHGAAFVTWVGFRNEQLQLVAGRNRMVDYRTETDATRSFCSCCGTTLFYRGPRWSGEIHVARANIDGEIDRHPSSHVYVDHRASWWSVSDDLPQYGGESGTEPKQG